MTLGSLFDGSGGFPLGAILCGITPVWAAEVEPYPIKVTKTRIPFMKHLGNVTEIDGAKIEPVDIITFGSPCQDLSIAGKRAGIHEGERSNLFFHAIRIVREMREATNGEYPRYIVWENVPGAFSSNKGEDFHAVLKEIAGIKGREADVPSASKWEHAGIIMADDLSIAWRLFDAQYWGVPQRRKRIYLVADLDGGRAGKILFEFEGVPWHTPPCFRAGKRAAGSTEESTGKSGKICLNDQGGQRMDVTEDVTCTLRAEAHHPPVALEYHPSDSRIKIAKDDTAQTMTSRMGTGGGNVPLVMQCFGICSKSSNSMLSDNPHSGFYEAETSRCLDANGGNPTCNQGGIAVVEGNGSRPSHHGDGYKEDDVMYTLNTTEKHGVAYGIERAAFNMGKNARFGFSIEEEMEPTIVSRGPGAVAFADKAATLSAADGPKGPSGQMMKKPEENFVAEPKTLKIRCGKEGGGKGALIQTDKSATLSCNNDQTLFEPTWSTSKNSYHTNEMKELANTLVAPDYKNPPIINDEDDVSYIVRRLTPTECARLQGFPDWWCENIENENPSEEDMEFWRRVFKTYYTINGKKTVKTDKQIVKWLSSDNGDSAKYKMWGNGVALPNVIFVLSGIAEGSEDGSELLCSDEETNNG